MRTIWKAALNLQTGIQDISLPVGSEIFAAGPDPSGIPCVWTRVDTSQSLVTYQVALFWTGEEIPREVALSFNAHIGTFKMSDLIYHAFVK